MMPHSKRKKWTEAEERTLIEKYGEMVCDGTLSRMKTREKKYRPIALYVNSMHHALDPVAYPWQWTWKDVSTKVQNMRHQYALVKQKVKIQPAESAGGDTGGVGLEEFDWMEGLTYWSNFLRYKDVFGDVPVVLSGGVGDSMAVVGGEGNNEVGAGEGFDGGGSHGMEMVEFGSLGGNVSGGDFAGGIENGVMGLEFEYEGEGEENYDHNKSSEHVREDKDDDFVYEDIEPSGSDTRKKRKLTKGSEKSVCRFVANQLRQLKEMEIRFEQRDGDRERERQRRESVRLENEHARQRQWEEREKEREEREKARDALRKQRIQEWEAMEKESDERERRRREEQLMCEREWEERMNRRRLDWKKRIDEMLSHHRAEMGQMQSRLLHEQQSLTNQLLGIVSQWTGHPTGLSDHTGASSHYLTQMMQNLHNVNGMVHDDPRVDGDNQEDQFIVDG